MKSVLCSDYLVTALQCGSHHGDIPNTLKAVVNTTISEIDNHFLNWLLVVLWVHKLINTKLLC